MGWNEIRDPYDEDPHADGAILGTIAFLTLFGFGMGCLTMGLIWWLT